MEKDGKTSYLFGSFHMGVPSDDVYPAIRPYFDASKAVITEQAIPEKITKEYRRKACLIHDSALTLDKQLDAERFARIKEALVPTFEKVPTFANLTAEQKDTVIKSIRPICAAPIYVQAKKLKLNINPDDVDDLRDFTLPSLDFSLRNLARKQGKVLGHLESMKSAKLVSCVDSAGIDNLKRMIDGNVTDPFNEMMELVDTYRSGSEESLSTLLDKHQELSSHCLKERNEEWISIMEKHFDKNSPSFFIVGAAHLVGKDNLVTILEKHGYHIKRM